MAYHYFELQQFIYRPISPGNLSARGGPGLLDSNCKLCHNSADAHQSPGLSGTRISQGGRRVILSNIWRRGGRIFSISRGVGCHPRAANGVKLPSAVLRTTRAAVTQGAGLRNGCLNSLINRSHHTSWRVFICSLIGRTPNPGACDTWGSQDDKY